MKQDYAKEDKKDTMEKPDIVDDEHLEFLDNLRESGITNMVGAGHFLQRKFPLKKSEASTVLRYWMDTFSERHPATDED